MQQHDEISEEDIEDTIELKLRNSNAKNIKERWSSLDSKELKTVYKTNDRVKWNDEVFQTIEQILQERGVEIRVAKKTISKAVGKSVKREKAYEFTNRRYYSGKPLSTFLGVILLTPEGEAKQKKDLWSYYETLARNTMVTEQYIALA